jgi:hypothetical protein
MRKAVPVGGSRVSAPVASASRQHRGGPSYDGAHAAISAGGAFVPRSLFGNKPLHLTVTSEALPGVVRSFDSFADAEEEASVSRIYAGQQSFVMHRPASVNGIHHRFMERC